MDFLQYIRYSRPQQYVVDNFQRPLLLFEQSDITDFDIWHTVEDAPDATFLTVSRAAANRVNNIVIARAFQNKTPLSTIPLENDVNNFPPFRDMRVVVTQNLDKPTGVVNGQLATIQNSQNNTLLLKFPNGKTTFTYPVATITEDGGNRVECTMPWTQPIAWRSTKRKALTSKSWSSGSTALLCRVVWDTSLSLGYTRVRTSKSWHQS